MTDLSTSTTGPAGGSAASYALRSRAAFKKRLAETTARYTGRTLARDNAASKQRSGLWLQADTPNRTLDRLTRVAASTNRASPDTVAELFSDTRDTPAPSLDKAFERILGKSQLLDVTWLERGSIAARAIGRIAIRDAGGNVVGYGTGFLVSPRLLITNNHVLPSADDARLSRIEFNYQSGLDGQELPMTELPLAPQTFFRTSTDLDVTLVAVGGDASATAPFGRIRVLASPNKIMVGEAASIIEHPGGGLKQVAIRKNEIIDLLPTFIQYKTDTAPGASGSPVFNDQWEAVALHHSGVPNTKDGQILTIAGGVATDATPEDQIDWLANEGVRISSIVDWLNTQTWTSPERAMINEVLSVADGAAPSPPSPAPADSGATSLRLPELARVSSPRPTRTTDPHTEDAPSVTRITIPLDIEVSVRVSPRLQAPATPVVDHETRGATPSMKEAMILATPTPTGISGDLPIDALLPGDILLYRGTGLVSRAIELLDGGGGSGSVSHAALFLSDGQVAEALGSGLTRRDLATSVGSDHEWVGSWRLRRTGGMTPVLARAAEYLRSDHPYAYQEIVLLAFLCLTRKVQITPIAAAMVRAVLDGAAAFLNGLITPSRTELLICSEFVYRCYSEATVATPSPYRIDIPGTQSAPPADEAMRTASGPTSRIEPASLLGQLRATNLSTAVRQSGGVRHATSQLESAPVSLDALLSQYFAQTQTGAAQEVEVAPLTANPAVVASVANFAHALYGVHQNANGDAALESAVVWTSLPAAIDHLLSIAPNFVTPNDLAGSPSLAPLGHLQLPIPTAA